MVQQMTVENLSIVTDPEIMGGTPVFVGTRVPVQTLFDYLMDGCTLDEFLDNFTTVSREAALQIVIFPSNKLSVVKPLEASLHSVLGEIASGSFIEL